MNKHIPYYEIKDMHQNGIILNPSLAVMVTGHRPQHMFGFDMSIEPYTKLKNLMRQYILNQVVNNGKRILINGGAIGSDQLFWEVSLEIRDMLDIPIIILLAMPFVGQESNWTQETIKHYNALCQRTNLIVVVEDGSYTAQKMILRDIWMVKHATDVLVIWNGKESGGTYHTLTYAKKNKRNITIINPKKI